MLTELEQLLAEVRHRRWTQYWWGPQGDPDLVAWTYAYRDFADVILLRAEDDATGYRKPLLPGDGPFDARAVMYQYHATAVRTLRAMLALPPPGARGAPSHVEMPAPACALPLNLPDPIVIRPLGAVTHRRR